ncbi:hypothetical protein [Bradyrhizobium sp. CCBAU 65884]|uniref:hypothetical protein n=1 Tax=Bradyrhizobium sp. CCBAU 65884 TaxID=722477 RepID=UPI002305AA35|nr:hypothetical protein [Bradyrhizobium sp. CCBAU 65884]
MPATAFSVSFAREIDVDQLAALMTSVQPTTERDGAELLSASAVRSALTSNAHRAASSVLASFAPQSRAHQGPFSGKPILGSSIPSGRCSPSVLRILRQ